MVMRVPDGAGGPGGSDGSPDDFPAWPGLARGGWRGWAGDVAVVVRRGWRTMGAVLLVTTVVPLLPLSGLVAIGVAAGAAISSNGKSSGIMLAFTVILAPALLALAAVCGLAVARGWTGAVRAVASAGSGRPAGAGEALRWGRGRSGLLWGSYLAGVAVLAGGAFLAGYAAPGAFTVPDLLVLAGPAGLLAPVLCFAPAAAWRRRGRGAGDPPATDGTPAAPAAAGHRVCLAPMALLLTVVVGGEVAAALALSWLMTSPYATGAGLPGSNGPAAAFVASLVALPGSVLLVAASSVTYARRRGKRTG
jgi:hypothetical protein